MVCDFEIKGGKECEFRRSGMKVVVNEGEFIVSIGFEVEKFMREVMYGMNSLCMCLCARMGNEMLKPESDVSGGLNNSMDDLLNGFMLVHEQLIAKNGLLES